MFLHENWIVILKRRERYIASKSHKPLLLLFGYNKFLEFYVVLE